MLRLIDAKKMEKQIKETLKDNPGLIGIFIRWIRKQPTVDAVGVVRCRECKHYRKKEDSMFLDDDTCDILYYIDGSHRTVCEEDFCSYGRKRDALN